MKFDKKDPENRNKHKQCCCGGHSANDVKKNTNHNSTKSKLLVRKTRKTLKEAKYGEIK